VGTRQEDKTSERVGGVLVARRVASQSTKMSKRCGEKRGAQRGPHQKNQQRKKEKKSLGGQKKGETNDAVQTEGGYIHGLSGGDKGKKIIARDGKTRKVIKKHRVCKYRTTKKGT